MKILNTLDAVKSVSAEWKVELKDDKGTVVQVNEECEGRTIKGMEVFECSDRVGQMYLDKYKWLQKMADNAVLGVSKKEE